MYQIMRTQNVTTEVILLKKRKLINSSGSHDAKWNEQLYLRLIFERYIYLLFPVRKLSSIFIAVIPVY